MPKEETTEKRDLSKMSLEDLKQYALKLDAEVNEFVNDVENFEAELESEGYSAEGNTQE